MSDADAAVKAVLEAQRTHRDLIAKIIVENAGIHEDGAWERILDHASRGGLYAQQRVHKYRALAEAILRVIS